MLKTYQLKACFCMIAALVFGTLVTRLEINSRLNVTQILIHVLVTYLSLFVPWVTIAYIQNLPQVSGDRRVLSFAAGTFAGISIAYIILVAVPGTLLFPELRFHPGWPGFLMRLINAFFFTLICYVVYNSVSTSTILQRVHLENEQLKLSHLRAQIMGLQQQLSPHFLFNSLNTLKTMTSDTESKNFVIQLSHVYRYMLAIKDRQVTTLADELAFVRSYLYIQHQRFDSALIVHIDVPEHYTGYEIPPLSIQLLIENAIKHNAFSPEEPLEIKIYLDKREWLTVSNSYLPKQQPEESTGLGLYNISERFHLLYDKKIEIVPSDKYFTVVLPIHKS